MNKMKRTPKDYQELLQNFKDLAIEKYGLDEHDEEPIEKIQTASTFKEVAEILREEELDDVIGVVEDLLQSWFSTP